MGNLLVSDVVIQESQNGERHANALGIAYDEVTFKSSLPAEGLGGRERSFQFLIVKQVHYFFGVAHLFNTCSNHRMAASPSLRV